MTASGRDGEFYREALELLVEAESIQTLFDEYPAQIERLMAEDDHGAALDVMSEIVALQIEHNLTLPDEFHFQYAQVAWLVDPKAAAGIVMESVNKYLTGAGTAGEFYMAALDLLDEAKQSLPITPEMMVIPAGRFRMGCMSDRDCEETEKPVREGNDWVVRALEV